MGTQPYSIEPAAAARRLVDAEAAQPILATAASEVALALGLVRVLTLLPLHDPALEEVEHRLAAVAQSVLELRRLLAEARVVASGEGGA